jgi:drug/metabolite transporter (DMT)-like permease
VKGALAGPLVLVLAAGWRGVPFWRGWTIVQLLEVLGVGFVGYGIGLALMVRAFRELGAARVGALFASTSLFAALSAILVLHERPTLVFAGAAAILATGVGAIVTEKH